MAGRLSRGRSLAALTACVVAAHWLFIDGLQAHLVPLHQDAPMPARWQMRLTQELAPKIEARPRRRQLADPGSGLAAAPAGTLAPAPALPEDAPQLPPPILPAADEAPGPEWPASTRLEFALTGSYNGPVHGDGQVEWLRQGRRYQVHVDVSVGPRLLPFIARRLSSEGQLGAQGIVPQRYDEDTRVILRSPQRVSLSIAPGLQDSASQFVHMSWLCLTGRLALAAGQQVELPLALPRRNLVMRYAVLGEEELATPMGLLRAWHLKPTQDLGGGELTAEMWLAPSLQCLPVRILIRQDAATYIDLLLRAPPLQAAESESIPKEPR